MDSNKEYQEIIDEFLNNEMVLEMKKYRQHFDFDCYDHCRHVAETCFKVAKKLNLDYVSITRAAMLHDLFLYDWHVKDGRKNLHAFTHGKIALENASKIFELNSKEKDMIKKHMWPVTPIPPKSLEGFILTFVDKHCTIVEAFDYYHRILSNKKVANYISLIIGIITFKK